MKEKLDSMLQPSRPIMGWVERILVIAIGGFIGATSPYWSPDSDEMSRKDLLLAMCLCTGFLWFGWFALRATLRWRGILQAACRRWGYTFSRKNLMNYTTLFGDGQPLVIEWDARGGDEVPPMIISITGGHLLSQGETEQDFHSALFQAILEEHRWDDFHQQLWGAGRKSLGWTNLAKGQLKPEGTPPFASFRWQPGMGIALLDPLVYEATSQLATSATMNATMAPIVLEMKTFAGPSMAPLSNVVCGLFARLIPWVREPEKQLLQALEYELNDQNRLSLFQEIIKLNDPVSTSALLQWILKHNRQAPATVLHRAIRLVYPHLSKDEKRQLCGMSLTHPSPAVQAIGAVYKQDQHSYRLLHSLLSKGKLPDKIAVWVYRELARSPKREEFEALYRAALGSPFLGLRAAATWYWLQPLEESWDEESQEKAQFAQLQEALLSSTSTLISALIEFLLAHEEDLVPHRETLFTLMLGAVVTAPEQQQREIISWLHKPQNDREKVRGLLQEIAQQTNTETQIAVLHALRRCGTAEDVAWLLPWSRKSVNLHMKDEVSLTIAQIQDRLDSSAQGGLSIADPEGRDERGNLSLG